MRIVKAISLITMSLACVQMSAYSTEEIRNALKSKGITDASALTQQNLIQYALMPDEEFDVILEAYDVDELARQARYVKPNFEPVAKLMIIRFQTAMDQCKRTKPESYKIDKKYGIFNTQYVEPVLNSIDKMNIVGFKNTTLMDMDIDLARYRLLQDALLMKYDPKKPGPQISAVAAALGSVYDSFTSGVKRKYSITENIDGTSSAKINGSKGLIGIKMRNGKVTSSEDLPVSMPIVLQKPNCVSGTMDYSYEKYPEKWNYVFGDEDMLKTVFKGSNWRPKTTADGEIVMESDYGVKLYGIDSNAIISEEVTKNPANNLFQWYLISKGVELGKKSGASKYKLSTPSGKVYDVMADGRINELETAAQRVKEGVESDEVARRAREAAEAAEWAPKGYMEVQSMDFHNEGCAVGEKITHSKARFIYGSLNVIPHTNVDRTIKLQVKVLKPNGALSTGTDSPSGYTYEQDYTITPTTNRIELLGWGAKDNSTYDPGTYTWQVWCEGNKLAESTLKIERQAASAKVVDTWTEYNIWHNNSKGLKTHSHIETEALRGKPLKFIMKFYKADGVSPAYYRGKQLSHTVDVTPDYDSCTWNDFWFFFPNSSMYEAVGRRSGTLVYKIFIQDASGKVYTTHKAGTVSWD